MKKLYTDYKNIWECKSTSTKLKQIKKQVKKHLISYDYFSDIKGNIFIGDFSKSKPCMVAHIDTVHTEKPTNITLKGNKLTCDTGIGGDDKCGIVAILEVLKSGCDINAVLTVDEEIGVVGAEAVNIDILKEVMYFIEVDRRGNNDITKSINWLEVMSNEFQNNIQSIYTKYGFKLTDGMLTDVLVFSEKTNKCSFNLSAGYYNPHTKDEYVLLNELHNTVNMVKEIVTNVRKTYLMDEVKSTKYYENDTMQVSDFLIEDMNNLEDLCDLANYVDHSEFQPLLYKAYDLGLKNAKVDVGMEKVS